MVYTLQINENVIHHYDHDGFLFKEEHFGSTYYYCKCHSSGYHNDDGPAIIHTNTQFYPLCIVREFWIHGELIYVERANGKKEWVHNGHFISASSKEELDRIIKLKSFW